VAGRQAINVRSKAKATEPTLAEDLLAKRHFVRSPQSSLRNRNERLIPSDGRFADKATLK